MNAYPKEYLADVVDNQGKLFDFVSASYPDCDTEDFINRYMASSTRKAIDEGKAYVTTMDYKTLWEYFTQNDGYTPKKGLPIEGFLPEWIGEFYAYYQWYYNVPSGELVKKISVDFLKKAYGGLHDLELELAVKKVGEVVMKIICFHNPNEKNGFLSNWFPARFIINGAEFSSVEQYMMYQKAVCFNDTAIAARIMETSDVAVIKSLGRAVSGYDDSVWSEIREKVVFDGLMAKFSQNNDLKKRLLATGDCILAECAVKDVIWGIGLSMKDHDRFDVNKWRGKNLLGLALMKVREELR
jgi:hypothetical protein